MAPATPHALYGLARALCDGYATTIEIMAAVEPWTSEKVACDPLDDEQSRALAERLVGQAAKMTEIKQGQVRRPRVQSWHSQCRSRFASPFFRRVNERFQVAVGYFGPGHFAAVHIGALPHGMPLGLVIQQVQDLLCDGLGITERYQHASSFA